MSGKLHVNDLVFAKMKGFAPWPGRIVEPPSFMPRKPAVKKDRECYCIYFFGSQNYYWCDKVTPYTKDQISYGKKPRKLFLQAIKEIENYIKKRDESLSLGEVKTEGEHEPEANPEENVTMSPRAGPSTEADEPATIKVENEPNESKGIVKRKLETPLSGPEEKKIKSEQDPTEPEISVYSRVKIEDELEEKFYCIHTLLEPTTQRARSPPLDVLTPSETLMKKDIAPSDAKIGFIGLGCMGSGLVKNLLNSGHEVVIWNRTPEKADIFVEAGATYLPTPRDVAEEADIIFSCASDVKAATKVAFGRRGVLSAIRSGKSYIEMTSITTQYSEELDREITVRDGRYLALMMIGDMQAARNGYLLMLASGSGETYSEIASCIEAWSTYSFYLGSQAGCAPKFHAIIQAHKAFQAAVLSEILLNIVLKGENPEHFLDVIPFSPAYSINMLELGYKMLNGQNSKNGQIKSMKNLVTWQISRLRDIHNPSVVLASAFSAFAEATLLGFGDYSSSALLKQGRTIVNLGNAFISIDVKTAPVVKWKASLSEFFTLCLTGKILIRNGQVVSSESVRAVDVYVDGFKILAVGPNLPNVEGAKVIDAKGMYVIPGGIDPHTHMEFGFMGEVAVDDFYLGTRAAVAGGTTTIIDFAIPDRTGSLIDVYKQYREKADTKVVCDYGLHLGITRWDSKIENEMKVLCEYHGVNSFKMFMAYKDTMMIDDSCLYNAFETCQKIGALPMVHAENGHIIEENAKRLLDAGITGPEGHSLSRPENVEAEAVDRACTIAENVGSSLYVVHVMSELASHMLSEKRKTNKRLFGEALAAGLGVIAPDSSKDYSTKAAYIMSPPLRSSITTPLTLMKHLATDGLQTTGSDNCTFNCDHKKVGINDFRKIPNGVNGVEDRLSIVWEKGVKSGLLTPQQFVAVTSENAAKIFNIYPKKGCIAPGSDADIVIWNPNKVRQISASTHFHACDFNIFEGMVIHGAIEFVLVKGRIFYENGQLSTIKGWGEFIDTPCYSPAVYF